MSSLNEYKVDHLFLLIGENPLPNYVSAKLLLENGGIVHLVHSTGTSDKAKYLKDILASENITAKFVSLGNYESDAYQIQEEITKRTKNLTGKLGLNYTGGTKAMAVHSYRAFSSKEKTVFSYLDARQLEICIDQKSSERIRFKIIPDMIKVNLETIIKLHGLKLKKEPTKDEKDTKNEKFLVELAKILAETFADDNKNKYDNKYENWLKWYENIFKDKARKNNKNRDWESQKNLIQLFIPLDNLPETIIEGFRNEGLLDENDQLSLARVNEKPTFSKKVERFCKWLDGEWLEYYVLQQIKEVAEECLINDYGMNFEIPLIGTENGFQFDVFFMRGYQLFAISCSTTNRRDLCKQKTFEVCMRAQQMGGSEARVAFIGGTDEPNSIKAEVSSLLSSSQLIVLGRKDFPNLQQKIKDWINEND